MSRPRRLPGDPPRTTVFEIEGVLTLALVGLSRLKADRDRVDDWAEVAKLLRRAAADANKHYKAAVIRDAQVRR